MPGGSQPPLPLPSPKNVQEDISQECRDLLPSLPREEGWAAKYYYLFQGFWFPTRHLKAVLACQTHFQARNTDILVVTSPKSGTTWLKAIVFALMNRAKYSDPISRLQHPLLTQNPHNLIPYMQGLYMEHDAPDLDSIPSPRLLAVHLPYTSLPQSIRSSHCKLVYLCRNPKDLFISLWHFSNKFRANERGENSLEESLNKFCRGVSIFGSYWDHVVGYYEASLEMPEKVLFLKYEEMKENPSDHLRRVAEFVGCPFSSEELKNGVMDEILKMCSFDNLRMLEVNSSGKTASGMDNSSFFRKGEVGDWENYLSAEMADRIDRVTKEKLNGSSLKL